jgi:hypothetical protein
VPNPPVKYSTQDATVTGRLAILRLPVAAHRYDRAVVEPSAAGT